MRAAEHAPRDPFTFLERRHGLAEIVERGVGVLVERPRVIKLHGGIDHCSIESDNSRISWARRVLRESSVTTLRLRWNYAEALYTDPGATLDDLREAVTTLEDTERIARRVLGGAHPLTVNIEGCLRNMRALSARETEARQAAPGSQ